MLLSGLKEEIRQMHLGKIPHKITKYTVLILDLFQAVLAWKAWSSGQPQSQY